MVASIIHEQHWQWPLANSTELLTLKEETLSLGFQPSGLQDRLCWLPSSSGSFSTSSAWMHFREHKALVPWKHIVWFSGHYPKASFILWLAVKKKLGTQDRLYNLALDARCLLCNSQPETHDHLFFDCPFSSHVWSLVCQKGGFTSPRAPWEAFISWVSSNWKGNSLSHKIKKLCLAISIYMLWRERNNRFHTQRSKDIQEIALSIVVEVRLKLSTFINMTNTSGNRRLQESWDLPLSIFSCS